MPVFKLKYLPGYKQEWTGLPVHKKDRTPEQEKLFREREAFRYANSEYRKQNQLKASKEYNEAHKEAYNRYQKNYHVKHKREVVIPDTEKIFYSKEVYKGKNGSNVYITYRYTIDKLGYVRRYSKYSCRMLAPCTNGFGYLSVQIGRGGPVYLIHRLVAEAFISNPENKPEVNHKNHIRWDNRIENLEWCTRKENMNKLRTNTYNNKGE